MSELRLGIIGLSRRAKALFLNGLPKGARITAVADLDDKTLDEFEGDAFKAKDYNEMLARDDVDAVCVMTRDYQHVEPAVAALLCGKTVFLEKPMAITIGDCDRILRTAYESGTKLFTGHNMRYMPVVRKMKEVIDSGVIGEVQSVWCRHFVSYGSCYFRAWCSTQAHSTGLLLQKGAHDIDVIHWLVGSYASRVVGMGRLSVYDRCARRSPDEAPDREKAFKDDCWPPLSYDDLSPEMDNEDHNMIMFSTDTGVQASYTQCFYTPDSERNYTFIGTRGRVENIGDGGDCEVHVWTKRGSRSKPDIIHHLHGSGGGHGGADPLMVRAFIDFANGSPEPCNSPLAARQAVVAGILAHESMRGENVPKNVPSLDGEVAAYFESGQEV